MGVFQRFSFLFSCSCHEIVAKNKYINIQNTTKIKYTNLFFKDHFDLKLGNISAKAVYKSPQAIIESIKYLYSNNKFDKGYVNKLQKTQAKLQKITTFKLLWFIT